MGKWIFHITALTLILGGLLGGVLLLHHFLFQKIRHEDAYRIAVTNFQLEPPNGYKRAEFLEEVRYLARWPNEFSLLDDSLPSQLAKGFAAHPWVETVSDVRITAERAIVVKLTYGGSCWR